MSLSLLDICLYLYLSQWKQTDIAFERAKGFNFMKHTLASSLDVLFTNGLHFYLF